MNIVETRLPGVLIIEPKVFGDERGFFMETWNAKTFAEKGLDLAFVQDNQSRSEKNSPRENWCVLPPDGPSTSRSISAGPRRISVNGTAWS